MFWLCFALMHKLRSHQWWLPTPLYHYQALSNDVVELELNAYPLGIRGYTDYDVLEGQLQTGDYLIFCSDGIAEAENLSGELFGYARTEETILQACGDGLSAEAVIDHILAVVATFGGGAPQGDDMTCVVLRVNRLNSII